MTLPNFLYLGPDKAGSSWLHEALITHPQVYLSPAKDLYFFDRYYERGLDWYAGQFRGATPQHAVVGEVCQDYLADPRCPARIHEALPDARLMVSLRDPVSRAFSSYLYARKHGLWPETFREAVEQVPELVEHGRYGAQLRAYRELFPAERIHVAVFDDLGADPQGYFDAVTDFLQVDRLTLSAELLAERLVASRARAVPVARAVRAFADVARRLDGARVVARVKRSSMVHRVLYTPLGEDRPVMTPEDREYLRGLYVDDVRLLEEDWGLDLRSRWGWDSVAAG
ncbi:sulfotransferase [Phycicoccus endophyticus]|uniref:Sulfotransferase n=1 Tax=Phycicoccus endophyticus TaxID=1690220 RepID=A0A7G9R2G0_9MICO|nr:sulfotransferase [Phycicoccus endophyticus]NHI20831.1 sulfotransferase [Phycicoccus endophyticus]QNN49785.1 sulfotransferase [Phycicoccus endophyticus]GGL35128.1 hypothetical protein GCM10012283_16930 [Phycicoccus endophyticus]